MNERASPVTAIERGWIPVPVAPPVVSPVHIGVPRRMPACPSGTAESRCGGRIAATAASKMTLLVLTLFEIRICGVRELDLPGEPLNLHRARSVGLLPAVEIPVLTEEEVDDRRLDLHIRVADAHRGVGGTALPCSFRCRSSREPRRRWRC